MTVHDPFSNGITFGEEIRQTGHGNCNIIIHYAI